MAGKKDPLQLGRREREILDIVFRLGEASVGNVMDQMAEPPAYDSVRTMLRLLERNTSIAPLNRNLQPASRPCRI